MMARADTAIKSEDMAPDYIRSKHRQSRVSNSQTGRRQLSRENRGLDGKQAPRVAPIVGFLLTVMCDSSGYLCQDPRQGLNFGYFLCWHGQCTDEDITNAGDGANLMVRKWNGDLIIALNGLASLTVAARSKSVNVRQRRTVRAQAQRIKKKSYEDK
jgi:hypothetical protein